MSVLYFPNRVYHGNDKVPAIDRVMARRIVKTCNGNQDLSSSDLTARLSSDCQWQIDSIMFHFNNVAAKNYAAYIANGIKIVANLNDYLWFQIDATAPQRVFLNAGFYTGTQLATHLQTKLDAVAAFAAIPITFTVTYTDATGLFVITPSAGTIRYLSVNITQPLAIRDSIAGHLFGLTTTTDFGANITSNVIVTGLDTEFALVSQTASTALNHVHMGPEVLSMDQAIYLTANSSSLVTTNYEIIYEEVI